MSETAVAVKSVTGMWTAAGVWTLAGGLFSTIGLIAVAYIRQWGPWKKIDNDREANLLTERAKEMTGMRATIARMERRLDAKEIQHEAERAHDRHRINNLATALNGFLMMVKAHPEDAATAATMIEELRARQLEEENRENIALRKLIADLSTGKEAA
jgi:hypothetical protein